MRELVNRPMAFVAVLVSACLTVLQAHAQENTGSVQPSDSARTQTACVPVMSTAEDSLVFQAGEELSFALQYTWGALNTDVGYATMKVDSLMMNGEEAFQVSVYGRTAKFFDWVFKVREDFRSCFTRDGIRPLTFTRDTYEGGYVAKNTYLYDWDSQDPVIRADVYSSKRGRKSLDLPLTPCTFDLPALFYFARNMDFDVVEPGRKYPMTFAIDDEIFNVYFILYGRETIKVKGIGEVRVIKFAARLLEGEVFKGEEDMVIYISDDMNRLPVYFEAPLLVGRATGRMTGWEGLKHPFSSIVSTRRK